MSRIGAGNAPRQSCQPAGLHLVVIQELPRRTLFLVSFFLALRGHGRWKLAAPWRHEERSHGGREGV